MKYDYMENVKSAVEDFFSEELADDADFAKAYYEAKVQQLEEATWGDPYVTGSHDLPFCDTNAHAKSCLEDNDELLTEAMDELDGDWKKAYFSPRYADTIIRLYLLHDACKDVINEKFPW